MRALRVVLVGLLIVGLTITSVGWYRSAQAESGDERFDSCRLDGETLILGYAYGANQSVNVGIDTRGEEVIVSLTALSGEGITPAIQLGGEARFTLFSAPTTVRYADGEELDCPSN